jgi:tetratricopeptide (TPR) repeat protein
MKNNERDWQEGDELFRQAEISFQRLEQIGSVGYTNMFWAQLKMFQKDFDTAILKHRKAEEYLLPRLSQLHADRAKLRAFEANIRRMQGQEELALKLYNQAVDMMIEGKNQTLAQKVVAIRDSGKIGYTN